MDKLYSINPAKGFCVNEEYERTTFEKIDEIYIYAERGKELWRSYSVLDRVNFIAPLLEGIRNAKEDLAEMIMKEMGKPYVQALDEVDMTLDEINYFLDNANDFLEDVILDESAEYVHILQREPWGIATVIAPWNYPLEISMWGIIPNLLAGNVVVYKASEVVLGLAKMIENIFYRLNLPLGVFSIVYGDENEGQQMVKRRENNLIWFTGSSIVGEQIYCMAARNFCKCVLEMGGSSPVIIFEDADIDDKMIENIIQGRFTNCGQVCSAIKRVLIHKNIKKIVISKLKNRIRELKIGRPEQVDVDISCLASPKQYEKYKIQYMDAVNNGAKVIVGGLNCSNDLEPPFVLPTLLDNVKTDMLVWKEEVFGPLLPIMTFESDEEAIKLANDTMYGLSAEIYSDNSKRIKEIANKIMAGRITLNSSKIAGIAYPFGGFKHSGMGRTHGKWGFEELTQVRYIQMMKK